MQESRRSIQSMKFPTASFAFQAARGSRYLLVAAIIVTAGCAANSPEEGAAYDPWEGANRAFYEFNDTLDRAFLAPLSDLYVTVTPEPVRDYVFNFFDNLSYPSVFINDFLQGKVEQGMEDIARFVVNSTLGLGGVIDIASGFELERHDEDLGQTLAVWGLDEGLYLDLPLFGPNSLRDLPDLPFSSFVNPMLYAESAASFPLSVLKIIDKRSRLDSAIRIRNESAVDPYVFQREAYRQRRQHLIYDGSPPFDDLDLLEEDKGGQ